MKRSLAETGFEITEAKKKGRLADLGTVEVTLGFESVPQDVLNAILESFDDVKDIKALGLTCSRLQNRTRFFWESSTSALVSVRSQPYSLHQKQFVSQKVIDMKRRHHGAVPFKLLDFSNLDPTAEKKEAAESDDDQDAGQFNTTDVKFFPWDHTRFVLLSCNKLAVFSIHDTTPLYLLTFKASAFNKIVFCTKTRSIGALVKLASGPEIHLLHDDNGKISLLHTIPLSKQRKGKKSEPAESTMGRGLSVGRRGKPSTRAEEHAKPGDAGDEEARDEDNDHGDDEEARDEDEIHSLINDHDEADEDELDDGDEDLENNTDEEVADDARDAGNDSEDEDEEDDYDLHKFRQTGYQRFVLGDKYVTVARQNNIKQYSTSTAQLVRTEKFSESEVLTQLHANEGMQYLEFCSVDLSPDGAKAYAWSTQHYFDDGPLYELDIETGHYRILFRSGDCCYDNYPDIEFLNDGKFMLIESLGSNASCWYVHRNKAPYPVIRSYADDSCGGTVIVSPDMSKCLAYNYGPVKVVTFRDPAPQEIPTPESTKEVTFGEYGEDISLVSLKWHPKSSSIFFCATGDKLHVVQLKENSPEVVVSLDQPFSNSFWFLQDIISYDRVRNTNNGTKIPHVLILFVDSDQNTICWDLPLSGIGAL